MGGLLWARSWTFLLHGSWKIERSLSITRFCIPKARFVAACGGVIDSWFRRCSLDVSISRKVAVCMQRSHRAATKTISILRSSPVPTNSNGSPCSVLLCARTNAGTRYHFITLARDRRFGLVDAITIGRAWGNSRVVFATVHCTSFCGLNMAVQLNIVVTLGSWNS